MSEVDTAIENLSGKDLATEIQSQEFKIGEREFRVVKLQPFKAYDVFQKHVRPCLQAFKGVDMTRGMLTFMEAWSQMPYEHLSALSKTFIRYCIECKNDGGSWAKMATDPDFYMKDMEPAELAFLDVRAFAVNFGGSASVFVREIQVLTGVDLKSILNQPIHSSGLESPPDTSPSPI